MRIAIFSDSYTPIVNGVSVSIQTLVEELRSCGHSVHIFASGYPRYKDCDPNVYRFGSILTPFAKGYPLALPPFYPSLRYFRRRQFDIVHTHTPFTVGFVGLRWAESHYLPIVSTYHTLYEKYVHYIPFFPKKYIRYKIAKHTNYYYNRCSQIIAPSEAALKSLRKHGVTTPVTIIPSASPPPRCIERGEARAMIGARNEDKLLLYVGRIAKEKNMGVLFEMAQQAMAMRDDIRLLVVGDGPYREVCQSMARELGIGDKVRFVGAVPRQDVDVYYAASDVFVFASMTETQGLVISEAMLHGLPAVVVHGGGASDAIVPDVNGFVVSNNPSQFASTVVSICNNPSLLGRLSEGARRSVKRWTVKDMCDAVLEVYERAIAKFAGLLRPECNEMEAPHEHTRTN